MGGETRRAASRRVTRIAVSFFIERSSESGATNSSTCTHQSNTEGAPGSLFQPGSWGRRFLSFFRLDDGRWHRLSALSQLRVASLCAFCRGRCGHSSPEDRHRTAPDGRNHRSHFCRPGQIPRRLHVGTCARKESGGSDLVSYVPSATSLYWEIGAMPASTGLPSSPRLGWRHTAPRLRVRPL